MIIHEMQQRSDEWYAVKCGKISASSVSDVLAGGKGITRKKYMMRLLAENVSGIPQETYKNGAMEWGIETEPLAKRAYEDSNYVAVKEVGFVEIDEFTGCSPDGMIGDDGLIEIKCPNTSTHLGYILENKMPSEYVLQVQMQLWVCDRKWCDFVSYDPRVPKRPLWSIRVERNEEKITEIKDGIKKFVAEMLDLKNKIETETK